MNHSVFPYIQLREWTPDRVSTSDEHLTEYGLSNIVAFDHNVAVVVSVSL